MRTNTSIPGKAKSNLAVCPVHCRQRGFTILEVMITVLILCLGLLGVGGLQYLSVKSNQSAFSRSIATEFANEMLDLIRSNPGMTATHSTTIYGAAYINHKCKTSSSGKTSGQCKQKAFVYTKNTLPAGADADTEINKKIEAWAKSINETLPAGKGYVCLATQADLSSLTAEDLATALKDGCKPAPISDTAGAFYVVMVEWSQAGVDEAQNQNWTAAQKQANQRVVVVGEAL